VLFGAQVKQAGGLLAAVRRGEDMGAEVIQVFAQSPRQWKGPNHDDEFLDRVRTAVAASPVVQQVVCHAPYLINLATPNDELYAKSCQCLGDNLWAAAGMGATGLVIHVGSHLGAGLDAALPRVVDGIAAALDGVWEERPGCMVLLENTAGAGGTIGRSFDELSVIIDRLGGDPRVGVCVDTQHLFASGVSFDTRAQADRVIAAVRDTVGLDRLRCLHVNDSKVGLGANSDRHENIGAGRIGEDPFRALLGHARLQGLPAILEIPGIAGDGPAADDLAVARRLHDEGVVSRRRRRGGP
jgi:deoxyribonuclease-4